jgi:hypothetical protein
MNPVPLPPDPDIVIIADNCSGDIFDGIGLGDALGVGVEVGDGVVF